MNARIAVALGMVAAAVAAAGFWPLVPMPKEVAAPAPAPHEWRPAAMPKAEPQKALEVMNAARPWGAPAAPAGQPPPPAWRLVGILRRGGEKSAVLKADGLPERHFQAGDTLPAGGKLLEIGEDAIIVLADGQKRTVEMNKQGPQGL